MCAIRWDSASVVLSLASEGDGSVGGQADVVQARVYSGTWIEDQPPFVAVPNDRVSRLRRDHHAGTLGARAVRRKERAPRTRAGNECALGESGVSERKKTETGLVIRMFWCAWSRDETGSRFRGGQIALLRGTGERGRCLGHVEG